MNNSDMDVVPVQATTPEFATVKDKFVRSLNNPGCKIVKVSEATGGHLVVMIEVVLLYSTSELNIGTI
jgi:hypothetical protein